VRKIENHVKHVAESCEFLVGRIHAHANLHPPQTITLSKIPTRFIINMKKKVQVISQQK